MKEEICLKMSHDEAFKVYRALNAVLYEDDSDPDLVSVRWSLNSLLYR